MTDQGKADQGEKSELGTHVPSSGLVPADMLVAKFNELNAAIVHGLPEMARAYDVLHRHVPLLREMQSLLSQRPKHAGSGFTMLHRVAGRTVRMARPVGSRDQLPGWTVWITAYAAAIDYSVRHVRRVILGEGRMKTVKECPWSMGQHNRLLDAATVGFELVQAIEAGADTTALCEQIKKIMDKIPDDVIESEYRPRRRVVRKKRAHRVTDEEC